MAGIWIKWVKGLSTKREVLRMAGTLQRDRHEVAGRLMAFWEWCDDNVTTTDCDQTGNACVTLGALQKTYIDSIAGVTGFADAMEQVGWATFHGEIMTIPNFARHNGETAKQRALTANRVSKSRQERNAKCNGASVTQALPEKRREEKSIEEENTQPPADALQEAKDHVAAWTLPRNATKETRELLAMWMRSRKLRHGSYLAESEWQPTVMLYPTWTGEQWDKALTASAAESTKNIAEYALRSKVNGKSHDPPKCAPLPPVGTITGWKPAEKGLKFEILDPAYEAAIAAGSTKEEAMEIGRAAWKKYLDEHPEAR